LIFFIERYFDYFIIILPLLVFKRGYGVKDRLDFILIEIKRYCRNLPFGGRAMRGLTGASSKKGKCAESPPTFIRGKRRKNWKGVVYEL